MNDRCRKLVLILLAVLVAEIQAVQQNVSTWRKVYAAGHYSFRLPVSMRFRSSERCEECTWGSTYSDRQMRLYAEFSTWNEEYTATYLQKQQEYVLEWTEIDGRKAKIQSWRSEVLKGFRYVAEVRFYDAKQKLMARMSAYCKVQHDVETAKKIFRSVDFPNTEY